MPKDRGVTNLPHAEDRISRLLVGPMFTRRRIFVGGVASVICAPAIVRAESLMSIRALSVSVQPVHADLSNACVSTGWSRF
jgi:hypothetical protein